MDDNEGEEPGWCRLAGSSSSSGSEAGGQEVYGHLGNGVRLCLKMENVKGMV